jgi:hypothetical protein
MLVGDGRAVARNEARRTGAIRAVGRRPLLIGAKPDLLPIEMSPTCSAATSWGQFRGCGYLLGEMLHVALDVERKRLEANDKPDPRASSYA